VTSEPLFVLGTWLSPDIGGPFLIGVSNA
jgi:hypothetical protein